MGSSTELKAPTNELNLYNYKNLVTDACKHASVGRLLGLRVLCLKWSLWRYYRGVERAFSRFTTLIPGPRGN
jgi:hypothetical protein